MQCFSLIELYVYMCALFKKCTIHQLHGPSTAPSAGILSGECFLLKFIESHSRSTGIQEALVSQF